VKGIRPELDVQVGTKKHGMDGIGNSEMSPFNRSILVGSISTSRADIITKVMEETDNLRVPVKLTALVKDNIFASAGRGMCCKEVAQPVDGGGLGDSGITMVHPSEVVSDKEPASLTIDANVVRAMGFILGLGARKGEVNGQSLVGQGGSPSGVGTSRFFGLLGTDASRAAFQDGVHVFELRDTFDMLVGIVQVVITGMAKAMVPEKSLSGSFDSLYRGVLMDILMEGEIMEGHGKLGKGIT